MKRTKSTNRKSDTGVRFAPKVLALLSHHVPPLLGLGFALAAFPNGISATGQATPQSEPPHRIVVSRQNSFEIEYPAWLTTCHKNTQKKDCQTYIAVCDETATACVAYPRSRYEGYNFEGAAFSVNEHPEKDTESKCYGSSGAPIHTEAVNGVDFQVGHDSSAGAGHGLEEDSYITFHDGKCYELDVRVATVSMGGYAPGTIKEFTEKDEQRVRASLAKVKATFKFLK